MERNYVVKVSQHSIVDVCNTRKSFKKIVTKLFQNIGEIFYKGVKNKKPFNGNLNFREKF